jgi:hypothetical protein
MCSVNFQPLLAVRFGGFARGLRRRQADRRVRSRRSPIRQSVGGVEQVLRKLCRELREFLGNRLEARLAPTGNSAPLRRKSRISCSTIRAARATGGVFAALGDRLVLGEQLEVLPDFGVETRDLGQHAVVGVPPGGMSLTECTWSTIPQARDSRSKPSASGAAKSAQVAATTSEVRRSTSARHCVEQLADRRLHIAGVSTSKRGRPEKSSSGLSCRVVAVIRVSVVSEAGRRARRRQPPILQGRDKRATTRGRSAA